MRIWMGVSFEDNYKSKLEVIERVKTRRVIVEDAESNGLKEGILYHKYHTDNEYHLLDDGEKPSIENGLYVNNLVSLIVLTESSGDVVRINKELLNEHIQIFITFLIMIKEKENTIYDIIRKTVKCV